MATRIQLRRDTATNWTLLNPILGDGEPGWDKTNGQLRVGDGIHHWLALPIENAGGSGGSSIQVAVQPDAPTFPGIGLWVKTGLGDGSDFALLFEDGL